MNNRLYCTFTNEHDVEETLNDIQSSYVILFDKIFILESLETEVLMREPLGLIGQMRVCFMPQLILPM